MHYINLHQSFVQLVATPHTLWRPADCCYAAK